MDPSPTMVEAPSPVVQYSRSTLLALYASPLVPDTLQGMKPLSIWYGEYQDPPSSPPTRTRDAPASGAGGAASSRAHNTASSSSNHTSNSGSNLSGGRPNPFVNFGRFGVDGGLDPGDVAGFIATKSSSGANDKRSRDGVPHLQREGVALGGRAGARRGETSIEGTSPTKSSAFGNDRLRASTRTGGADERNGALGSSTSGRREEQKKDRRAADEGGWRSVGGLTDRDRRTGRGNDQPRDLRDLRNDKRDRNDGLNSSTRGQRQPAWMDSDGPHASSGSAPSWMDAPISNENFELGGRALPPHDRERGAASSSGVAGAPEGGVDSIAAFKKQMKELERIKSGGGDVEEPKQPSESVFASLVKAPAQQQSESQPSVLDSLRSGGEASTGAEEGSASREGGRSSRFAKYFDGKPPAPATSPNVQPQQAPSVFEALLGGGGGGGGGGREASKGNNAAETSSKDAESMARLMGMLQFSSARATSPVNSKSPAPIAFPPVLPSSASAPMPTHPQPNGDRSRQTSGSGSRFAFSQTPSNAQPSGMAQSQPYEHQPQPPSRSVSGSHPGPSEQPPHSPPRQNFNQATHAFALPPLGSPSSEARLLQPQHSTQQHHHPSAHSRAASAQPVSPPVSANYELPPSGPQSPGGMPPPPPQFLQMLNGMQSPPPQQQHMNGGVASRPLPPINNGMPPPQGPPQQQHPIPGGPHQMPHFQSPPPPPPHMGFGNSPISPEIAAAHMRAMSNPSRSQPPPFNMPPPPFMYGGPPPPMGSMAPNMPPFPAQFRPPPPPPGAFSGAGVPDLMALLNSGEGPRIGAASAPLPPRARPMLQGQQPQQQQQQQSMRQFMSPPPMNHGQ